MDCWYKDKKSQLASVTFWFSAYLGLRLISLPATSTPSRWWSQINDEVKISLLLIPHLKLMVRLLCWIFLVCSFWLFSSVIIFNRIGCWCKELEIVPWIYNSPTHHHFKSCFIQKLIAEKRTDNDVTKITSEGGENVLGWIQLQYPLQRNVPMGQFDQLDELTW